MSENKSEHSERYRNIRTEFDDLKTNEKVLFLLEATVATVAKTVDSFAHAVYDMFESTFRNVSTEGETDEESEKTETDSETPSEPSGGSESTNVAPEKAAPKRKPTSTKRKTAKKKPEEPSS